jgi:hypothetical protein
MKKTTLLFHKLKEAINKINKFVMLDITERINYNNTYRCHGQFPEIVEKKAMTTSANAVMFGWIANSA